jgi:nucleoside-diphosphate-sugar epimerase
VKISATRLAKRSIAWKTMPSMERIKHQESRGKKRVLIAGYGYIGSLVGHLLAESGTEVVAMSRTMPGGLLRHPHPNVHWFPADLTCKDSLSGVKGTFDHALFAASSSRGGSQDYRQVYCEGVNNLMTELEGRLSRSFIYLSSTGVYGQNEGEWVDESMPVQPTSETGQVLVEAENYLFRQFQSNAFPGMVLRLSGIYGPGRGYAWKRIQQGNAVIESPGERWVNMIHREDAANAVIAAFTDGTAGEAYNVTDDVPVRQLEFYEWLASTSGNPIPKLVESDPLKPSKRQVTHKRISNRKLKQLKNFKLKYPSFKEGYPALMK